MAKSQFTTGPVIQPEPGSLGSGPLRFGATERHSILNRDCAWIVDNPGVT